MWAMVWKTDFGVVGIGGRVDRKGMSIGKDANRREWVDGMVQRFGFGGKRGEDADVRIQTRRAYILNTNKKQLVAWRRRRYRSGRTILLIRRLRSAG